MATQIVQTTTAHDTPESAGVKTAILKSYQFIWFIVGAIEFLLGFRFVLKVVGANPGSPFVQFIYGLSAPFANFFRNTVPASVSDGFVAEWSTLIAMAFYLMLTWFIFKFFQIAKPVDAIDVEKTLEREEL